MGIDRNTLDQLRNLLRPLATRVANSIARGVVQLVDDGKNPQLPQLCVLAVETVDGRGGGADSIGIGRLGVWRRMDGVYGHAGGTGSKAKAGVGSWFTSYHRQRPHAAHGGQPK